ncbi:MULTISPECIES: formate dehydrogenase accessory protein FdhE [Rhodomicrobium]|uniref:formate dehydrogenase accessory protein FdhE n=1 Tax=Rhodomicrobium TaxID=1068 RepID=UPI000B4C03C1|nr:MULTISPECIES: formate dehydrogenase accessory protein FdhE [Rhodomicrobium]
MSGQTPQFGDLSIGKAAADEFVRLPRYPALFEIRAARMKTLAAANPAAGFLGLMVRVFSAQADASLLAGEVVPPSAEAIARAREHAMPPIATDSWVPTATYRAALRFIAANISRDGLPQATIDVLAGLGEAPDEHLDNLARAHLESAIPPHWQGEAIFAVAALQVEFARIASLLPKEAIKPLDAPGLCPCCGSPPVAGVVVADHAFGRRFLSCGLCSTSWHYVRVACITCGTEKDVAYQEIEGGDGVAKCESCDDCRTYSKIFYQQKNMAVEALCDDLATLSLDLMVNNAGWKRHAPNPFVPVI